MKKQIFLICIGIVFLASFANRVSAHCEIPCGIYDDEMRIQMILEHVLTIEKSINAIKHLGKKESHDSNQLIRWIMNKERHAEMLQEIVTQYFMTQRIKPEDKDYEKKIRLLHQMLIEGMKCKQTTDLNHVEQLRQLTKDFKDLYFK
ncbi:MAG: superoxide dismutase [Ni] [Desulfobacterales bacterium]